MEKVTVRSTRKVSEENDLALGTAGRERWWRARMMRDYAGILSLGEAILSRRPDDVQVRRCLAQLLAERGRREEAIAHWTALHLASPRDIEPAYHLSRAEMDAGLSAAKAIRAGAPKAPHHLRMRLKSVLEREETQPGNVDLRHVAICGVSYCGSTILDRILGSLPHVGTVGESHWLIKPDADRSEVADFAATEDQVLVPCTVCGDACAVFSHDFRLGLAADRTRWYYRIAHRLGAGFLISSDKNATKIVELDPLLRLEALVMFKSPRQAWKSHLAKLPDKLRPADQDAECQRYMELWRKNYSTYLRHFNPEQGARFLNFDRFAEEPERHLRALCRIFGLEFDAGVLERARPGHAIGGNKGTRERLDASNYEVEIRPLAAVSFTSPQERIIEEHEAQEVYARLMARHDRLAA